MPKNSANQKATKSGKAGFSALEKKILLSRGVTDAQIRTMIHKGIRCRDDFRHVGDAGTLAVLWGRARRYAG